MRLNVSNSLYLSALLGLAIMSVGLKAASGALDDGRGAAEPKVNAELARILRSQGFSTSLSSREIQSSITYGTRGDCRLSVRDAREGVEIATVFLREASHIGPVRYLYRGQTYETPPAAAAWLDRFGNKVFNRLGMQRRIAIPIALATSPACGGQNFGLSDFRV